jgi:hypothetical protein
MPESNPIKKLSGIPPGWCINPQLGATTMSPENLSRRAILAGAVSVPVFALPALATVVTVPPAPLVSETPDPIIAAIAEHRRLDEQYQMWCTLQEQNYDSVTLESAQARVSDAAHKAGWALTKIKPTTAAGAVALFGYVLADVELKRYWHLPALSNATTAAKQTEHADADLFVLGNKIITAASDACYASPRHDKAEEAEASWLSQNPQPDDESAFSKWCEQLSAVKLECQYDEATELASEICLGR